LVLLVTTAAVMAYTPGDSTFARSPSPWWEPTLIDGLGVSALLAGALAVSRGVATPANLASSGDPLLAMLPLLALMVVAWLAIRLVPLCVAAAARLLGRRAPLVRTALGEVGRRPALPLATAGFLAAATTLGVFSFGYRATLQSGAHDQAAFAVPYDITLTEGPALIRPSAVAPVDGWEHLAPSARSTNVLRRGVAVLNQRLANDTVTLIGVDPSTLTSLRGWRSDFGPSLEALPALIAAQHPVEAIGTFIPAGTTSLSIAAVGDIDHTSITAVIEREDGVWHELEAEVGVSTDTNTHVEVALSPGDTGGRLIGLRFSQPGYASDRIQHHVGEGTSSTESFTAKITLEAITAIDSSKPSTVGTPLNIDWSQLRSDGAVVTLLTRGIDVALRLQGTTALVVPAASPEMEAIPAIVDPTTAAGARNGLVSISVVNNARRVIRVAAIATRFPGAPARFAIVDRSLAQPAFDLINPGLGTANETWIAVNHDEEPQLAQNLSEAPFTNLITHRRSVLERRLNSDPLSVFALGLFGVAALMAGLLAAAALYLSTRAEAAEQEPLHRALAADGATDKSLSRMVLASALASAVAAIFVGVAGALVLLSVVTRIIAVTAAATAAVPPLLADQPMGGIVLALTMVALPAVVTATLAARSARRVSRSDLLREFG
jgi:hypothetical protein